MRLTLWALLRPRLRALGVLLLWTGLLAATTAGYGALAGPALRALFGGGGLAWPGWLAPHLPPPPSLEALRMGLPWAVLAIAGLKGLAFHRQTVGMATLGQGVVEDLRVEIHARLLTLPPDEASALGVGRLSSLCTHDADQIERWVTQGVAAVLRDGLQVLALLGLCVVIDWRMAALAFGVYPLAFWPIARFARRLRRTSGAAQRARGELSAVLHDQMTRLPVVQLCGIEPRAGRRFGEAAAEVRRQVVSTAKIRAFASPFTEVLGAGALAVTLFFATQQIEDGALAAEHLFSFLVALLMLYQPVKGLVRAQEVVQPGRAALDRLHEILGAAGRLPTGGRRPPPNVAPELRLDGLALIRGGRVVFRALSARCLAGEITAIVGANGAGKSSLAWVVAGLLEPSEGRVLIDEVPLSAYAAGPWRRQIGWVTQAPLLGRGTLRENVMYGHPDASQEALERAARLAGLGEVVARLPEGWDTVLGDGGAGLSGGEQRRVAVARALVGDPKVLVLDEPAAHLDAAAAAALWAVVPEVAAGRTTLLISHAPEARACTVNRIVL